MSTVGPGHGGRRPARGRSGRRRRTGRRSRPRSARATRAGSKARRWRPSRPGCGPSWGRRRAGRRGTAPRHATARARSTASCLGAGPADGDLGDAGRRPRRPGRSSAARSAQTASRPAWNAVQTRRLATRHPMASTATVSLVDPQASTRDAVERAADGLLEHRAQRGAGHRRVGGDHASMVAMAGSIMPEPLAIAADRAGAVLVGDAGRRPAWSTQVGGEDRLGGGARRRPRRGRGVGQAAGTAGQQRSMGIGTPMTPVDMRDHVGGLGAQPPRRRRRRSVRRAARPSRRAGVGVAGVDDHGPRLPVCGVLDGHVAAGGPDPVGRGGTAAATARVGDHDARRRACRTPSGPPRWPRPGIPAGR